MNIQVKPVLRSNFTFQDAPQVRLLGITEMKDLIHACVLQHPFNKSFITKDSELTLNLNVAVGGEDYSSKVPWALIEYDSYLISGLPVALDFHLVKYLGDDRDYPFGMPDAEVLMARGINWTALKSTMLHEFSHLMDGLNPKFQYSINLKQNLTHPESHRLQSLWNEYINCRLAVLLGSDYTIRPSEESSSTLNIHTYPELVRAAKSYAM